MDLCLISTNIRFANPGDGEHVWEKRREVLVQTLLSHSPDLISTQEGRFDQLSDLASLLPDYVLVDQHRSWIRERMYPSIFIKKDRFELGQSGDLWLSETPDIAGSLSFGSTFPRLMTWVWLQGKGHGEKLLVVNTHLDHIKSETREEQVRVLSQEIKNFWKNEGSLILTGDYNDSPSSRTRGLLSSAFPDLQDAWKMFNNKEETSHHAFKGESQNGHRIDWILVDKKIRVEDCRMDKSQRQGIWPSDHFPIVCRITL